MFQKFYQLRYLLLPICLTLRVRIEGGGALSFDSEVFYFILLKVVAPERSMNLPQGILTASALFA